MQEFRNKIANGEYPKWILYSIGCVKCLMFMSVLPGIYILGKLITQA